mmetsp:Transcript_18606/g.41490  ORF Transcript_18606/g.41490 Transcript_18606/m.41490 type:complete len:581 (-) Transcript_18606:14-1756(-)
MQDAPAGQSAGNRTLGLPPLQSVLQDAAIVQQCPTVAGILFGRRRAPSDSGAGEALVQEPNAARTPRNNLLPAEERFLESLSQWLTNERDCIRRETEDKLRESFHGPPGERRTVIELQRQKWRAIEEAVRQLDECVREVIFAEAAFAGIDDLRATRAEVAQQELQALDTNEASAREKVRALIDLKETFGKASPPRSVGVATPKPRPSASVQQRDQEQRMQRANQVLEAASQQGDAAGGSPPSAQVVERLRHQQLDLAVAAVLERQSLLRANAEARRDMYSNLWWTEADVHRLNAAKQCVAARAAALTQAADEEAAEAVGTLREQLYLARQEMPIPDPDAAPEEDSTAASASALQAEFMDALQAVSAFRQSTEERSIRLAGEAGIAPKQSSSILTQAQAHDEAKEGLKAEQARIEAARESAARRIRLAEAELDRLGEESGEIGHDLAARWSQQLGADARDAKSAEARRLAMLMSVEDQLATDASFDLMQSASAAKNVAAAVRAKAEDNHKLAIEEQQRVAAALQEAEEHRLVPVRLRIPGLRLSQIQDVKAFEHMVAKNLRAVLDLDDSQLRVIEINEASG